MPMLMLPHGNMLLGQCLAGGNKEIINKLVI